MKINGNLACQEELREEILHGEAVAMSPLPAFNHNQVAYNIARLFGNFLAGRKCTPIAGGSVEVCLTDSGQFVLDNVYTVQYAWAVRQMPAEERAAVVAHFRCSLFDDLEISLDDIFSGLLP